MPMLQTWINQKMADYRNKPVYQQIVTGDRIDVDRLHELGNRAMEPSGQIRLMNMTFTKADVDQLYRRILEAV